MNQNFQPDKEYFSSSQEEVEIQKNDWALGELVKKYQGYLQSHQEASTANICFTANTGRVHFEQRLAGVAESNVELQKQLTAFIKVNQTNGLLRGQARGENPKVAFIFTGEGSEYVNMGWQLYQTQPTFRQTLEECDQILRSLLEKPLLSVLYPQSTELAVEACENGHQKGILKNSLNPIAELLSQIDTNELIEELNFSEELTEQEQKLLPKLLKLLTIQTQKSGQSSEQDSGILQQLEKSPTRERLQLMLHYLQGAIGQLLGFDDFRILDSQLGFFDMGMNHTMMLELKNRLETSFGCSISVTTLSEHYNIQELAKYLITKIFVGEIEEKYAIDKYEKQQTIVETELKQ